MKHMCKWDFKIYTLMIELNKIAGYKKILKTPLKLYMVEDKEIVSL